MKYSELEKKAKKNGCYDTGEQSSDGHPIWRNPKTGEKFKMSNHRSQEVKKGTLNSIMKKAGLE